MTGFIYVLIWSVLNHFKIRMAFLHTCYIMRPHPQEKYKRALADTENLRQRSQKLVEEAKLYGKQTSWSLRGRSRVAAVASM